MAQTGGYLGQPLPFQQGWTTPELPGQVFASEEELNRYLDTRRNIINNNPPPPPPPPPPNQSNPYQAALQGQTGRLPISGAAFPEENPFAYWMSRYGLPAVGGSPLQKWQASQFGPAYSTFLGSSALEAAGGGAGAGSSFADYLGMGDITGSRTRAADILRRAGALGSEGEGIFRSGLSDSELGQLIRGALSSKYAAPVAQRLSSLWGDYEQQYVAETMGAGDTFLSYLLSKFRI